MNLRGPASAARSHLWQLYLSRRGCQGGVSVRLHGLPLIYCVENSTIVLGNRIVLSGRNSRNSLEARYPVILRTVRSNARIVIGDDVGITSATIAAASEITIGPRTLVGTGVMITDSDHHDMRAAPEARRYGSFPEPHSDHAVHIGADVFIGARSMVLKGVTIGRGSVIGAGSVVTQSIPERVVAAGNPCTVRRPLD